jgi:hypothetical protein
LSGHSRQVSAPSFKNNSAISRSVARRSDPGSSEDALQSIRESSWPSPLVTISVVGLGLRGAMQVPREQARRIVRHHAGGMAPSVRDRPLTKRIRDATICG